MSDKSYLRKVVYLSEEQFDTLTQNGTITVNGVTLTLDDESLYITPAKDGGGSGDYVEKVTEATEVFRIYGVDYNKTTTKIYSAFWTPEYTRVLIYNTNGNFEIEDPKEAREAVNLVTLQKNLPTIYTDANETTTTKTLNIYTDSNGYLHIDTE